MNLLDFLKAEPRACCEALDFAQPYETFADAVAACDRTDWLLWALIEKCGVSRNDARLRRFGCWCVRNTPLADGRRTTWDLLTDERSRAAVEIAERFCDGKATRAELSAAWGAAADAAEASAWNAVRAAARAASDAAGAAVLAAADAAADAAWVAVGSAAGDAARVAAWVAACEAQCGELRRLFAAEIDETSRRVAAEGGGT